MASVVHPFTSIELGTDYTNLMADDLWHIAVPLSPSGARVLGRGTAWCTSNDVPAFHVYHNRGPLIIFRRGIPDASGRWCWQLHAVTGEFRDQYNRKASWRGFLLRHHEVAGLVLQALAGGLATLQKPDAGASPLPAGGMAS
jgi:hypothetical protein